MIPMLDKSCFSPIRVRIDPGEIVRLSDDARFRWTHAIPSFIPNFQGKWTVMLKFAEFNPAGKVDWKSWPDSEQK